MKLVYVQLLVWVGDMIPDEMEDYLDDVRLSVTDLLSDIPHSYIGFIFPAGTSICQAKKQAIKNIYDVNKSAKCMVVKTSFLEEK